jgi:glyoxylase-like metal-dependent hydrolase (beta-lactamase superfamily II)
MLRPRNVTRGVELFPARTPTLPPATHTNSYALGDREILLVEPATPYDDERRAWVEWANSLRSQGRTIVAIAITHHHGDHVGGAAFLSRELNLPLWAHEATARRIPGIPVSRTLDEGAEITLDGTIPSRWRALLTPGHAPGHLCFWNEDTGALVVGDMVASVGTIVIEPNDGDMIAYLAELARLAALNAAVALPAHGDPIDAPSELFHKYIAHRRMREAKVVDALARRADSPASLDVLVPEVYGDTSPMLWPIARMSLEAHLLKLEREGRAARRDALWLMASIA